MVGPTDDPAARRASALRYGVEYRVEALSYGRVEEMLQPRVLYVTFELVPQRRRLRLELTGGCEPFELGGFRCHWSGPKLQAEPSDHFSDPHAAAATISSHLRSWAAWAELSGYGAVEFLLRHWAVVDDYPGQTPSRNVVASLSDWSSPDVAPTEIVRTGPPPSPPSSFETTPTLEVLRDRFRAVLDYLALPSVEAYFVLSTLEGAFGGRKEAAAALNVDMQILSRIGLITAIPDPRAGRKGRSGPTFGIDGALRDAITDEEQAWLVVAVQELLVRFGTATDPPRLTMDDLPPLPPST